MEPIFIHFVIALGLGLLVGLQRTWADHEEAGIRTFPLITLLGFVAAILADSYGGWVVGAGLLAVTALLLTANLGLFRKTADPDTGVTTEMAALVMYGVGAMLGMGFMAPALVTGGVVAVLLHSKEPLHGLTGRIGKKDFEALIRLTIIALVILPVLPDRDFGPFRVLNPFEIWLMVVLIVGISMAGYVAFKLFGSRAGAVAAGILGGLISSTATTVSYAGRTVANPARSTGAALVILLASTVVFGRVLLELGVVAPELFGRVAPPLFAMMGVMVAISAVFVFRARDDEDHEIQEQEPPSDIKAALTFGGLYAAVLLAVAFAREFLGPGGLYVVAGISGLTDIDAITLSTAQLMKSGGLSPSTGWRVVQVGALANLVFKGGVVLALGHPKLRAKIALSFGLALVGGVGILWLWPG
jgi:uncharacterized membrane protein (DUF4010 family)